MYRPARYCSHNCASPVSSVAQSGEFFDLILNIIIAEVINLEAVIIPSLPGLSWHSLICVESLVVDLA